MLIKVFYTKGLHKEIFVSDPVFIKINGNLFIGFNGLWLRTFASERNEARSGSIFSNLSGNTAFDQNLKKNLS